MMVIDQFAVDRAFGGRFQPKDGWLVLQGMECLEGFGTLQQRSEDLYAGYGYRC